MATHIDPLHASAKHQLLHHFGAKAEWPDKAIMQRVREWVMPALGAHVAEEGGYYWIIDDTGFPKKGRHLVGVGRQYCGQFGKQKNCQIAVSLSIATQRGSLPIAWRRYAPRNWIDYRERARRAGRGVGAAGRPPGYVVRQGTNRRQSRHWPCNPPRVPG